MIDSKNSLAIRLNNKVIECGARTGFGKFWEGIDIDSTILQDLKIFEKGDFSLGLWINRVHIFIY